MRITRVEIIPVSVPYPEPYVVASSSKSHQADVLLKVHTDEGIVGLGEAVYRPLRGCTLEVMVAVLQHHLGPLLIGEDPLRIERIIAKLGGMDSPWLPALHAVDLALWDIKGKYLNLPVYELLGGAARRTITLSRSLPVKAPGEMAERAVALKEAGYRLLTVKIGFDPDEDLRRVAAVKDAVGPWPPVEVDANEGYTADVAVRYLRLMEPSITAVEQPTPWWDLHALAEVSRALEVPVIADQSVPSARHVAMCARMGAGDVMCLKLVEVGGITLGRAFVEVAQAHGIPVSMGSAHPLGVGTAAIHHFAAATPWVRLPIGYGSPLERLPDDIVRDPVQVRNGEVHLWDGPGLGVELDEAKVRRWAAGPPIVVDGR